MTNEPDLDQEFADRLIKTYLLSRSATKPPTCRRMSTSALRSG